MPGATVLLGLGTGAALPERRSWSSSLSPPLSSVTCPLGPRTPEPGDGSGRPFCSLCRGADVSRGRGSSMRPGGRGKAWMGQSLWTSGGPVPFDLICLDWVASQNFIFECCSGGWKSKVTVGFWSGPSSWLVHAALPCAHTAERELWPAVWDLLSEAHRPHHSRALPS